jgi:flagellar hook-associated protein 3 FlgL
LAEIQYQIATQSKVNKPSDNPLSNSRIMRLQSQLKNINTYRTNISYGKSMLDNTITSLDSMQSEILNVMDELTKLNSPIVDNTLESFASYIDGSIKILVDLANTDFNGQYSFGGAENGSKPFTYDEANGKVVVNSDHIGGDKEVRISRGIKQKFNISGKELFQSVSKQLGNLNSNSAVGDAQTTSSKVYDAEGNEYTLNMTYTKTADNKYNLNYTVVDSDSNTIKDETISDVKFNPETGKFEAIGNDTFGEIHVEIPNNKIDFVIDISKVKEKDSATNLNSSLSQKADIFNTLIAIRDGLNEGKKPTAEQIKMVNDFNQHVLNMLSKAGGISNKLDSTEQVLRNRELEVTELLSAEKDVDVAKALIDLETKQYTLDLTYKISSMILPKSLMDYL